jgi:hypothetical protein
MEMKLTFEPFDGRSFNDRDILDEDINQVVGWIASGRSLNPGIHISLFDGKYKKTTATYPECVGFVKGVESVLNHMTATTSKADDAKQGSALGASLKQRYLTMTAAKGDQPKHPMH